tara:strand:+ start:357 stop:632 length:276 start_codon:yes stop_codon:yes gene_type:complete
MSDCPSRRRLPLNLRKLLKRKQRVPKSWPMIASTQIDQCTLRENAIIATINSVGILQPPSAHILIVLHIAEKDAWHATSNGRTTDSKKDKL